MTFIWLAALGHVFWAISNLIDKNIVSEQIKSPFYYFLATAPVGVLVVLLIPFIDFYVPPTRELFLSILAGIIFLTAALPYLYSMKMEEASRINFLWGFIPLLTLLFGWFSIGETLKAGEFLAFLFLLAGIVMASWHIGRWRPRWSSATWLMLLSCTMYSITNIIQRYVTQTVSVSVTYVWMGLAMGVLSIVAVLSTRRIRRGVTREISRMSPFVFALIAATVTLDKLGQFFYTSAFSRGPAALVTSMLGVQMLIVFLGAWFVSLKYPKIFREEIDRKNIALKAMALLLIIVGITILTRTQL